MAFFVVSVDGVSLLCASQLVFLVPVQVQKSSVQIAAAGNNGGGVALGYGMGKGGKVLWTDEVSDQSVCREAKARRSRGKNGVKNVILVPSNDPLATGTTTHDGNSPKTVIGALQSTTRCTRGDVDCGRKKLTDYFPVRRSERQTRSRLLKNKQHEVEEALLSGLEEGLKVEEILGKGRGVITTRPFKKGEFVVEYSGELIGIAQAVQREQVYAQDENTGCYMYYFLHNDRHFCVDATVETGRLGRLINHSRTRGNLLTKSFVTDDVPHLIFVAKRDIRQGEELLYDYGDRSKASLAWHPWLAT